MDGKCMFWSRRQENIVYYGFRSGVYPSDEGKRRLVNVKLVCFLSLAIIVFGSSYGQEKFFLEYEIYNSVSRTGHVSFDDSLSRKEHAMEVLNSLQKQGYLSAFVEDTIFKSDTLYLKINAGDLFEWVSLEKGNLEEWMLSKSDFQLDQFSKRPFQYNEVLNLFTRILMTSQNNGFPFADIRLIDVKNRGGKISARIKVAKGPFITFDTLKITGNSKTHPLYLARKLGMLPGVPFSQKMVDQSMAGLRNIPYITLRETPSLSFQNEEATYYLPINDRRMNSLDGIIGLLPNELEENKWLITGQFDLELYNVSGKGRDYSINWQRLSQYTQNLSISAVEPMVLGSMLDIKSSFYLLKEDTTFINREFRFDVGYQLNPSTYLSFFTRRQAGDLLAVSQYRAAEKLPEAADFRYNSYGLDFMVSKLDDVLFPKKGWQSQGMAGVGNKRLLENTGLPQSLYQGLEKTSFQYYFRAYFSYYLPWKQQFSSLFRLSLGEMENENLLSNDLFRLGGLKSIRGFNENYFFANRYAFINIEPRYYFDNHSYFLIFADAGLVKNKVFGSGSEWPYSFGGGISLENGGGIFNFIYAVGKSKAQPLGFNYSRIHFGYTGRF
ncbi:MAG: hypothetical protein WD398_13310 [Cyclobacteriaceae bacterium]